MTRARHPRPRVFAVIVVVAVVAAVVVGLVVWVSSTRAGTAQEAARDYLRALESGDSAAVAATGVEVSPDALVAFDSVSSLLTDGTVVTTDQEGSIATAQISFTIDGDAHEAQLALSFSSGRWVPDASALTSVTASPSIGSAVAIGDAVFPTTSPLALLPAVYTLAAAPTDLLDGSAKIVALPGADAETALDAELRPEASVAAQSLLDEHLTDCAASTIVSPPACGIRIPWGTEFRAITDASFRIEALPDLLLDADGRGFTADGGGLVATLTGTGQDGTERSTTYRTDDWAARGDIAFTTNGMTLTVW